MIDPGAFEPTKFLAIPEAISVPTMFLSQGSGLHR